MSQIVVIGASQGGVRGLQTLMAGLGADFPAPIVVVLHIGAGPSMLPSILGEIDGLSASFGRNGEQIVAGKIYVAPPDHHLLVNDGVLELSRAPRENWARPAIDPLFRSAASSHGSGAIGIILSGQLNDGTAGLYAIKRWGGIAIVQTPSGAEAPSMPQSALENVAVDYCLPVEEMPRLLKRLVRENSPAMRHGTGTENYRSLSLHLSGGGGAFRGECTGSLTRFRCHIGHVMTAEVLASVQLELLDHSISAVRRMLNERQAFCRDNSEKAAANGNDTSAANWQMAADEAAMRAEVAEQLVDLNWHHPEAAE